MPLYPLDENKRVIEGPYQGEIASSCNKYSGTLRIPGVQLTADEAKKIRTRLNMGQEYLHLDKEALLQGTYCINIENPSNNQFFVDHFDCADLGETGWFGNTRCDTVKKSMQPFLPPEKDSKVWIAVQWLGGIITLYFLFAGPAAESWQAWVKPAFKFLAAKMGWLGLGLGLAMGIGTASLALARDALKGQIRFDPFFGTIIESAATYLLGEGEIAHDEPQAQPVMDKK